MRNYLISAAFSLIVGCGLGVAQETAPQGMDWWGGQGMGHGQMWPQDMPRERWEWQHMGSGQRQRMQRHWAYMNDGVPADYRGARNPLQVTSEVVDVGGSLYSDNCAACHGTRGFGDGEAGRGLVPSPALLNQLVRMPMAGDEYLFWAISEGGEQFGTDMPAFKDVLEKEEIWQIIAYMRSGFPTSSAKQ